ncbi:V-type ATP synthase alpha chain [Tateyamaria omphalii]|uniref:V-type ATP synthase subunit A n=1 Tax=Tateyamaria omphalii TaxID=299262 RepID=UPI001675C8A8|nr:V-type ATP synthase subunit A [Tateyamaria omphalii]GGX66963.1 V-type ATP synthase alpha chain [Tateyamaria omphalii]
MTAAAKKVQHPETETATARIVAVQEGLVRIESMDNPDGTPGALVKNEMVYILPSRLAAGGRQERLKAEILRVRGNTADAQVYESTQGVAVGDPVVQSGQLLSVALGPGLLGQVYDGLQAPLKQVANAYGIFLPRGADVDPLDRAAKWSFTPSVKLGDTVTAGQTIGTVPEGRFTHKIMLPFNWTGTYTVNWVQKGAVTVNDPVARLTSDGGQEHVIPLSQRWPVRRPMAGDLLKSGAVQRKFPDTPVLTSQRLIDTFFPIARGGTACIPGPFGAGKTVLQNLIARNAQVDVVIIVACGERAGEVVETITEYPEMIDPTSGGSLMDRTIIICNTSSMPVAAREASIFTGITLGEYYRQMGLDVLLIADSTSRWAQAMRETSGRLEEIPGEEGFPAYLESSIKGLYERAGVIEAADGATGSLTMIGTVSPAGGNFDEPVTQATLSTVKCFLGLSSERAYKRFYPAVDPLLSWSRYLDQMSDWYDRHIEPGWTGRVKALQALLEQGEQISQMMMVTGEEGVTLGDYVTFQKALFVDMIFLQQDAFDAVDSCAPLDRQQRVFGLMQRVVDATMTLEDKGAIRSWFTEITGLFKNFHYAADGTPEYTSLLAQIEAKIAAL